MEDKRQNEIPHPVRHTMPRRMFFMYHAYAQTGEKNRRRDTRGTGNSMVNRRVKASKEKSARNALSTKSEDLIYIMIPYRYKYITKRKQSGLYI